MNIHDNPSELQSPAVFRIFTFAHWWEFIVETSIKTRTGCWSD